MRDALCRPSGTTLDTCMPRGGPPITQRTSGLGLTTGSISSLNEAWFHTLDTCVIDSPLSEIILSLMRNCFFVGAMHAVLLLQKGHGVSGAALRAERARSASAIRHSPEPASRCSR